MGIGFLIAGICILTIGIIQFSIDLKSEEGKNLISRILKTIFNDGLSIGISTVLILSGLFFLLMAFIKILILK